MRLWLLTSEYPPLPLGGLGAHVFELATALSHAGHDVHVFVSGEGPRRGPGGDGPCVHDCQQSGPFPLWGYQDWKASNDAVIKRALEVAGTEGAPDLIHCHDWMLYDAACRLREMWQRPAIATVHMTYAVFSRWGGSPSMFGWEQEARMCVDCDALITVSHSMQAILMAAHDLPQRQVTVVHNGLSPAWMSSEASGRAVQTAHPPTVVCIGRAVPQKGIASLIRSAELVLAAYPGAKYRIIGGAGGHYKQALQAYCKNSAILRNCVCFEPPIERSRLHSVYADADLALIPSCYEPFGYAALEAMLAGVCVVAADVGGLAEIIAHRQTGFLVPVHAQGGDVVGCDPVALARLQCELLADTTLRARVEQAAFHEVTTRFTASAMAAATIECYQDTCQAFPQERVAWSSGKPRATYAT